MTSFTTLLPIEMSPELIVSNPAIIRSNVDFPQPDGPTQSYKFSVLNVHVYVLDNFSATKRFMQALKTNGCHVHPLMLALQ